MKLPNQKGFAPILIIIAVLVVLAGGILLIIRNNQTIKADTPDSTLQALENSLLVRASINDQKAINWKQDNSVIPLVGREFRLGTFTSDYIGKYGNYAEGDFNSVTENSLEPLKNNVDSFFVSNGFQKNNENTFRIDKEQARRLYTRMGLIMGYTKNDFKCLISLEPQTDLFGSFFCGIYDKETDAMRKRTPAEILKGIPLDSWKTYTNSDYGFSFKYPPQYTLKTEKKKKDFVPGHDQYYMTFSLGTIVKGSPDWSGFFIDVQPTKGKLLKDFFSDSEEVFISLTPPANIDEAAYIRGNRNIEYAFRYKNNIFAIVGFQNGNFVSSTPTIGFFTDEIYATINFANR